MALARRKPLGFNPGGEVPWLQPDVSSPFRFCSLVREWVPGHLHLTNQIVFGRSKLSRSLGYKYERIVDGVPCA